MKGVAIILLNWHGWQDTLECLGSLEQLDYANYSVLIIDNASTDDSVVRIQTAYPDIPIIINERNLGFGGGCNVGIRHALQQGADYVWLLNNDTIVEAHTLTAMVEVAEADPTIGAVGSVLYYMDEPEKVQAWGGGYVNFWRAEARHHFAPAPEHRLQYLTGASLILRRAALEQVGLFDEQFFMYWEDVDIGFRLRKGDWRMAVAEKSCVRHKVSASLGKNSPLLAQYLNASVVRFYLKYAPSPMFSIAVAVGRHMVKRLLHGDFKTARHVFRGAWNSFLDK